MAHAGGRPSTYSAEMADAVCQRIANGESIRAMCLDDDMPAERTVYLWLEAHPEFVQKYAHARERQADFYAAEIVQIADDGRNDTQVDDDGVRIVDHDHIARSRLRVDARKWYASKLAPKKYGDRQIVDATLDATVTTMSDEQRRDRLAELLSKSTVER